MNTRLDEAQVELLMLKTAQPVVRQIVARYAGDGTLTRSDADDVAASVNLRLIEKMRRADTRIENFDQYAAMVTYNAVHDHLRVRYPARTRLKSRLRYILSHDPRLWLSESACGLRGQSESEAARDGILDSLPVTPPMRNGARPADALAAILEAAGRPVSFDALVRFTAALWDVVDAPPVEISLIPAEHQIAPEHPSETREYLAALWKEIRELRPMQRKALLLNLRDSSTVDAISLFILTGTAGASALAEALEMPVDELAAIWNDLPFDDLRIAAMLEVTRQQVINLRKSARTRLSRRMDAGNKAGALPS